MDKFDGTKERWPVFLTKFKRVSSFNEWTEKQKLAVLINSLRGKAADQLDKIPEEKQDDLEYLINVLGRKFDPPGERISQAQALEHRERMVGESYSDYADALVTLAKKAYGHLGMESIKTFAMTRFLAGLPPKARDVVFNKEAKTLDEALEAIEAYDQYKGIKVDSEVDKQIKSKQRSKMVASMSSEGTTESQASLGSGTTVQKVAVVQTKENTSEGIIKLEQACEVVTKTMIQVAETLKNALPRQEARPYYKPQTNPSPGVAQGSSRRPGGCRFDQPTPRGVQDFCVRPRGACHNCGSLDHWRNSCPHPPKQSSSAPNPPGARPGPALQSQGTRNQGNF
jgi:hypothetical protein